jgi:hypothetical protein
LSVNLQHPQPTSTPAQQGTEPQAAPNDQKKWPGVIHDQVQKHGTNPEPQGKSLKTSASK